MSKDMLGPLMRALVGVPAKMLGLLLDIANRLGSADGENFYTDLATFVREWKKQVAKSVEVAVRPLLEFVSSTALPAATESFIASAKFVRDTSDEAMVKISAIGGNFTAWFLGDDGKTEPPFQGGVVYGWRLLRRSVDGPIIKEQGGEAKAETTLTEVFSLMVQQPNGPDSPEGVLLTDGRANIFYCRDKNGVLRAVGVDWLGGGWGVFAYSVERPFEWFAEYRVFSRNSVLVLSVPLESAAS